ncbi:MAG: hypothetical protein K2Z81_04110 [Cyanobacteria bacterium]|nr:hypothetical protein [Cyanobacteriota bacterium]
MQIKNWEQFQHYKKRRPLWIKLYRELLDDEEFHSLSPQSAKILIGLWLLASEDKSMQGLLPSKRKIAFRLRISEKLLESSLSELNHWVVQDASNMLAGCEQDAISETEREKKTEREKNSAVKNEKTEKAPTPTAIDWVQVAERFNQIPGVQATDLQKIKGTKFVDRIKAVLKDHPQWEWWESYFGMIEKSPFLCGKKTDFRATLYWALGPINMTKVLSGLYLQKGVNDGTQGKISGIEHLIEKPGDETGSEAYIGQGVTN